MSTLTPAIRNTSLALLAAGTAASLSACGLVASVLSPGGGNVMELSAGDCFVESEMEAAFSGDEVTNVPLVDCSEPHDAEVFHTEDLPDGDFPGEASLDNSIDEICYGSAFANYVGVDFMDSELEVWPLVPTEEGWDMGDQEILCYALDSTGTVSESFEGSNR